MFLIASLIYVVTWVGGGQHRARLAFIRSLPVAAPLTLLAAIVVLGAIFSPAPTPDIVNNLKVYSKLLLVLMLAFTFAEPRWRARAWSAFTLSMGLVLASTYANVFVNLPWSQTHNQGLGADHSVFMEYVSQSVMTAIFIAFALHRAMVGNEHWKRLAWGLAAAAALGSVLFLLKGRSGLMAVLVVIVVFLALQPGASRKWFAALGAALLGSALVATSPLMSDRLTTAYQEIAGYQLSDRTSIGLRIGMWRLSIDQMAQHPLTGTGSGTYHQIAARHFGHCEFTCTHPHNQYLFFGMEYGIAGLLAYVWLLWRLVRMAHRSQAPERALLYALVAVLAVDSLFNVPLWYRAQSYFFYTMLGLLLACNLPTARRSETGDITAGKPEA